MSLEWESKSFSDLVDIIGGGTPKTSIDEYWNGDIPWISIKDFNSGQKYVSDTEKTITELGLNNSSTKILEKNDIIISARGTVGEVAMIKSEMAFNQSCYGLRVHDSFDKEFVYYLLKYNIYKLKNMVHGAVFDTITTNTFDNIIVNIPPLEYQEKISYLLSNIDNLIEVKIHENKNLTRLSSIIFINLMEKSNNFFELNECCKFIKGKKPKETSDYPQPNFLDYLTIDVLSNQSQMYAYDEKGILANEYDILMVMDGASSGKLFYGKTGLVGSTLAKLNVEEKYLEIVYQFLKQSEKFISDNTTGSAIPHTDKGLVLSLKCPISEELLNYSETFKSIRSSIITNNNEILKLQKLRDTLLPKLMSGEIDVTKINCDLD